MDTLLRLVGYGSIPLVVVSVFFMVRGLGSDYRLRVRGLVITAVFAVAVLALFDAVLDIETPWTAWAMGAAGVVAGILLGRSTPLRVAGDDVFARRTPWTAGAWLACYAYAQLAVLGAVPGEYAGGLRAMFLATGVAVGTAVSLARSRGRAVAASGEAAAADDRAVCAQCGRPNPDVARFCAHCGWHVVSHRSRTEVVR